MHSKNNQHQQQQLELEQQQQHKERALKQLHYQMAQEQHEEEISRRELYHANQHLLKHGYFGMTQYEFFYTFVCSLLEVAGQGDETQKLIQNHNNNNKKKKSTVAKLFTCTDWETIDLFTYAERISRFSFCGPEIYVASLIYIDRLMMANFEVSSQTIHKILLTSIVIASKFFDEKYFDNVYFARVGGVSTKEFNRLEIEFLKLIDYRLHILPHEFTQYTDSLLHLLSLIINNSSNKSASHGESESVSADHHESDEQQENDSQNSSGEEESEDIADDSEHTSDEYDYYTSNEEEEEEEVDHDGYYHHHPHPHPHSTTQEQQHNFVFAC